MYSKWAAFNNLKFTVLDQANGKASLLIKGPSVWDLFKYEAGKHCVQRIPPTERRGRKQTSMVSVAITPLIPKQAYNLDLKEVQTTYSMGSGPGGQHKNRTMSCVQAKHLPTGIMVRVDNERSQPQNRAVAYKILASKIQAKEEADLMAHQSKARREQMQGGGRSGKIRTYNFMRGTVTDHVLNKTTHDIKGVMGGRLDRLICL